MKLKKALNTACKSHDTCIFLRGVSITCQNKTIYVDKVTADEYASINEREEKDDARAA